MAEAAREHKVATQMGNQGQASEQVRLLCETIWDGAIGQVREVHVWTDRPSTGLTILLAAGRRRPADTPPVPETLDWDLWLGPAPQRPYHPAYLPSSGEAGGILAPAPGGYRLPCPGPRLPH